MKRPPMLTMLSGEQKLAEIKRLYYQTTRPTIAQDLAKAIDLVKSMTSEEERERAAVYMDGLSQMRSDWARQHGWKGKKSKNTGRK
ncbi:MAG TPA: hypothetical protein VL243_13005 [Vicinamibacterales bacterium]|nr:hypothetical protein [Vicinamibacterales bacterium]